MCRTATRRDADKSMGWANLLRGVKVPWEATSDCVCHTWQEDLTGCTAFVVEHVFDELGCDYLLLYFTRFALSESMGVMHAGL
jgi:hypothetical protein